MRYLMCLIIGLFIGALAAATIESALRESDVWPRSIMHVMQHALSSANRSVHQGHCSDADLNPSLRHLALLAGDIEPALQPGRAPEPGFVLDAHQLRAAIAAIAANGSDCAHRRKQLATIGNACDTCHREFR
ncbi:MAG: hypothetical protein WBV61_13075 [Rhodanobacteraceae bacterium]